MVEVASGDTADQVGVNLRDAGVVQSAEAYIDYARAHADASARIQVGFYEVKKKMSAAEAFAVLTDPANIRTDKVTMPEGLRVVDIVDLLVKQDRLQQGRVPEGARQPCAARAARRTPTATRRATSSPRRTPSARRRSLPTCSSRWSTAGGRPPTTSTSRHPPGSSATPRTS
jgi:cell division protein YceG involved in septum cleavage